MSDDEIEKQIQAAGANVAPRVTPEDLLANIVEEHYFTAAEGVFAESEGIKTEFSLSLHLLTFCVIVTRNGFTVVGKSAVASPENFKPEIGRAVARTDAINQMWPLMGYALKERLMHEADKQPT